jgi:hypothetical protein
MRAEAERRFDERVVEIFFDKMVPEEIDFRRIRNDEIPLRDAADGYRRLLLLGTTGAGKTTVARQLIGSDPKRDRFPSTSTAKTTVHDTEIVICDGEWRAIATFVPADEVREYLAECSSAAVLAAWQDASDKEILRRLLNHVNQRYRFSYVLGSGPSSASNDFDEEDEEIQQEGEDELPSVDMASTNAVLADAIGLVKAIAARHGASLREVLEAKSEADERVIDELFEEELDDLVREDEQFHLLNDMLLDEIEKRFEFLDVGEVRRTKQGWPISWSWQTADRTAFFRAISRFSSNYSRYWGRLLTPLVNGVRVAGPFQPTWWSESQPKLVILDGEGLGHSPRTAAAVSTSVVRLIKEADAVVLVDNATQPMQAAAVAAMRELVSSGNASKLIFAFTHFDEVKGDNFPSLSAKVEHVLASAENVTASIGEDLGPFAERAVRKRLVSARVFLADIQRLLTKDKKSDERTIAQFDKLMRLIELTVERPKPVGSKPHYDKMDLVLAVKSAAENFHNAWFSRLGLEMQTGWSKEHWTRVKALSRRLATGMADHYDTLHPVADLRRELLDRIYVFVQNPLGWTGDEPDEPSKIAIFDRFADAIADRLLELSTRRVWRAKSGEWQEAYYERKQGSTFRRAGIIGRRIFDPAATIPDVTPSPERNLFLKDVVEAVQQAANEIGVSLS